MKRFLALILLSLLPSQLFAANWYSTCQSVSELAESIMTVRQHGVPIYDAMKIVGMDDIDAINELSENLVLMAYERPRYSSEENQKNIIGDFRDSAYLMCAKALNK